jgi:hypothetical protein
MNAIRKLTSLGSDGLSGRAPRLSEECAALAGPLADDLLALLSVKNGFYAFESALLVFPADPEHDRGLERWNSRDVWRDEYGSLADGCLFFAMDVLGGQFCIADSRVFHFDPETTRKEPIAPDIQNWAALVLDDYRTQTGWPLAHEWQQRNRPLARSERLVPKTPFILGGEFVDTNLYALDAVKAMRFYGNLAKQIHDLPPGTPVQFKIV